MLKRSVAGGLFALSFAGAAFAQNAAQNASQNGFYLRAGAGVSFVNALEQDFTYNPTVPFVGVVLPAGQTVDVDSGFVAAAAIGFDYADGIRTELEYRYATSSIANATGLVVGPAIVNDDLNAHFILSNFYYDFQNSSALTPFIGLGVGGAFVENEFAQRDAALAYQGRVGASVALNGGYSIDAEYIYLRTNDLVYGPSDDDFTPMSAVLRIDGAPYVSSSVMVSLRKQF